MGEPAYEDGITFVEAARLDPDRFPGEVDRGRWVPVTRSTYRHGEILVNVAALLKAFARAHPEWRISGGDPGTKLARDPDVLRGPDVAVVRRERWPTGRGEQGWLDGAPDVAIEIAGDSQAIGELTQKAFEYMASGTGAVWILDPDSARVIVFTPPDRVRVVGPDEELEGEDALPGFRCAVRELFE